jgi:hypothetical protein
MLNSYAGDYNSVTRDEILRRIAEQEKLLQQDEEELAPSVSAAPKSQIQDSPPDPTKEQPQQQPPQTKSSGNPLIDGFNRSIVGETFNAQNDLGQALLTAPMGVGDFIVDAYNQGPATWLGMEKAKKPPAFKGKVWQSLREAASVIIPTWYLSKVGLRGGVAAQEAVGAKLGTDPVFKWFARAGLTGGVGAGVDSIASVNQNSDNLSGFLKKEWPKTFGWISDDWATVAGDSPDVYRAKNVKEGVGLGWAVDLAEGAARLIKAGADATRGFKQWIPKDETAKVFFEKLNRIQPGVNPLETADIDIEKALDELGSYRLEKHPEMVDSPTPVVGIHDVPDSPSSGIRRTDPEGAIGAIGDAARVQSNTGTSFGRLRNFISEPALKYGLDADNAESRAIVRGVEQQINDAGKFDLLLGAKKFTYDDLMQSTDELAARWYNSRMSVDEMKQELAPFQTESTTEFGNEIRYLGERGVGAVTKFTKEILRDYTESSLRASGLASTQKAGQLSDTAEASRLMEGTDASERTQEQILDMMEFLMVERGISSYLRGRGLANMNIWKRIQNLGQDAKELEKNILNQKKQYMAELLGKTKNSVNQLRELSKERPEFLKPLLLAWELTDGNVDTLSKLNNFAAESLTNVGKAFIDSQPDIPNVIIQGAWANIFNSTLSAAGTTAKAFWGNASLLLLKPVTAIAGAAMRGDMDTVKRAWFTYSAFGDTLQKGLAHMSLVFRKASQDPTSVSYIIRDDLAIKNDQTWEVLKEYADAAEREGNDGPSILYEFAKNIDDMANHPLLRLGTNALSATDGFTRAVIANAEARFRTYERFISGGEDLNGKTLRQAEDDIYRQMFGNGEMITDKAIDFASREISMNLDMEGARALSSLIQKIPVIRPFMMFPRTSINMIAMVDKFSPVSVFLREYNDLSYKSADLFTPDEIRQVLTSKGIEFDAYAKAKFDMVRAEALGRKAIGTTVVSIAGFMFMNDRLTGDGVFDKERQKTRESVGWKPRSYLANDGKWYSYDGLGPISDWIAAVATTMDHFDTLDPRDLSIMFQKFGFVLSTTLTGKSPLAGVEPVFDILRGNPAAANRWAASFSNNLAPLGGLRAEIGRIMSPSLRELDMDFNQLLRNRNNYLDVIDPKGSLPYKTNWLTGEKINGGETFWARAWNAVMPFKSNGTTNKYAKFLMDIEYDGRPTFMTSSKGGVDYDPKTRAELFKLIGENPYFRQELDTIMKEVSGPKFREEVRRARSSGEVDATKWRNIHYQVDDALRMAKRMAEIQLSNYGDIREQEYRTVLSDEMNKGGTVSPLTMQNK